MVQWYNDCTLSVILNAQLGVAVIETVLGMVIMVMNKEKKVLANVKTISGMVAGTNLADIGLPSYQDVADAEANMGLPSYQDVVGAEGGTKQTEKDTELCI